MDLGERIRQLEDLTTARWPAEPDQQPVAASLPARVILIAATVVYVALFTRWTFHNHAGYGTFGFDLGIYDQGLWLLSRFKAPFVTIMGRNLFGDHTSFILLPLVPLYWVWPSPRTLLFLQAAALGLGAVPVFLIARDKLRGELLGSVMAVVYLVQPALGWTNFEQFHPDVFEVPLLLFALWFMMRERWVGFFVCVALLLSVKEDVPVVVFVLGVYILFKHSRRVGLITMGAAASFAALTLWWVLPTLNGVGSLNGWRIPYGGPWGLTKTAVLHPWKVMSYALSGGRAWYLWQLFAPVAMLSLAAPSVLALAIGPLALNVLSTFQYQYHIQYHYTTLIVPVLVVAAVFAISRPPSLNLRRLLVALVAVLALLSGWWWGATPFARAPAPVASPHFARIAYIEAAMKLIPPKANLSTFYGFITHVEHREHVYEFPVPWKAQNWGTFKQEGKRLPQADTIDYVFVPTDMDQETMAILDSVRPAFDTVYDQHGVLLLKRKPA